LKHQARESKHDAKCPENRKHTESPRKASRREMEENDFHRMEQKTRSEMSVRRFFAARNTPERRMKGAKK
jgi:hypothetical protein